MPPTPGPPTPVPPPTTDACYLGANSAGTTCLATVSINGAGSAYTYPAPLNGSTQYARPLRVLDLNAHPGSTQLAPNFRLDEFAQAHKGRYAVVQPHAVARVQAVRNQVGALRVNSGYRSPGYNSGISGAATWSRHMYGDGFDFSPMAASLTATRSACEAQGAGFTRLYTSHIHCDWRNSALSTAFFAYVASFTSSSSTFTYLLDVDEEIDAWIEEDDGLLTAPAIGWPEGEPLREWLSLDADGFAIEVVESIDYVPHPEAVSVEVVVGGELFRTYDLAAADEGEGF